MESSITEWASRSGWGGRPIGHAQTQGVLVSALGVFAMYYGPTRRQAASRLQARIRSVMYKFADFSGMTSIEWY
jgi:hypothetical protein